MVYVMRNTLPYPFTEEQTHQILMSPSKHIALSPHRLKKFHRSLLDWYSTHKRDLPWRHSDDPYAVWISEMMLQQTQVAQARPYFERFMKHFPTVADLGKAPLDEVLKLWEGLGYYARARNLHRAARQIVHEHHEKVPDEIETISKLPGIGPYTSAAVLSIAFGKNHAVVDGNVIRVISRLFHLTLNPSKAATKQLITDLANRILKKGRAADFNQAMMELGATVCTPRKPSCHQCPVNELCQAKKELDDPSVLPLKAIRKKRPHYKETACLIRQGHTLLIIQKPLDGLLGGLWEFPGGRYQDEHASLETSLIHNVKQSVDITIEINQPMAIVKHAFTHFGITLYGYYGALIDGEVRPLTCADCRWVTLYEMKSFAFSKAHNMLIDAMYEDLNPQQLSLFDPNRKSDDSK